MKKIYICLVVLLIITDVNAFQYLGNQTLCVINEINNKTCLQSGDNYTDDGDLELILYERNYNISGNTLLDVFQTVFIGGCFLVACFIGFVFIKKINVLK